MHSASLTSRKIQEETLRTYIYTNSAHYASLSLSHLSTTFSLDLKTVIALISRMIYSDDLPASLDQLSGVIVFHRIEQSEVQRLAQQLAERASQLVEQNEKALDAKLGTSQLERGGDRGGATDGARGGRTGERRGNSRGRGGRGTWRTLHGWVWRYDGRTTDNCGLGLGAVADAHISQQVHGQARLGCCTNESMSDAPLT